jgi:hypothetical protein
MIRSDKTPEQGRDPVVASLLRTAAGGDLSVLGPLADRLEELGDERAVAVCEILAYPAYLVGPDRDAFPAPGIDRSQVLGLFPEYDPPLTFNEPVSYDALGYACHADSVRAVGPAWGVAMAWYRVRPFLLFPYGGKQGRT